MTTMALTDTEVDAISRKVCEKLMEILPSTLLPMIQETFPSILQENIPLLASKITEQQKLSSEAESEANEYINEHYQVFDRICNIRTKKHCEIEVH